MRWSRDLATAVVLVGLLLGSPARAGEFLDEQLRYPRVREAHRERTEELRAHFAGAGAAWPPHGIYLRAHKREDRVELWATSARSAPSRVRVRTFEVCSASGTLGPKRRQGDLQSPRGCTGWTASTRRARSTCRSASTTRIPSIGPGRGPTRRGATSSSTERACRSAAWRWRTARSSSSTWPRSWPGTEVRRGSRSTCSRAGWIGRPAATPSATGGRRARAGRALGLPGRGPPGLRGDEGAPGGHPHVGGLPAAGAVATALALNRPRRARSPPGRPSTWRGSPGAGPGSACGTGRGR